MLRPVPELLWKVTPDIVFVPVRRALRIKALTVRNVGIPKYIGTWQEEEPGKPHSEASSNILKNLNSHQRKKWFVTTLFHLLFS